MVRSSSQRPATLHALLASTLVFLFGVSSGPSTVHAQAGGPVLDRPAELDAQAGDPATDPVEAEAVTDGPVLDLPSEVDAAGGGGTTTGDHAQASATNADSTQSNMPQDLGFGGIYSPSSRANATSGAGSAPGTTSFGGYGELHFSAFMPDGGDTTTNLDLHRVVLFFGHHFGHGLRFYSELEIEHAFIEGAAGGEVALEQAYLQWDILDRALSLRVGMVLVPMGVTNRVHEPPSFHGVERPSVDKLIIPTTWREGGIGLYGEPVDGLRYEAYLLGGLDPSGFSQSKGIRGGRQGVSESVTDGPAVAARVSVQPMLGLDIGLAGYFGLSGPNTDAVSESVPVGAVALDARVRRGGIEGRALLAYFHVGDTGALRANPMGTGPISDVGSDLLGGYLELGYDVLHTLETTHALVPFARAEWYDTTFSEDNPAFNGPSVFELTVGADYRPIPQVVFKADVQMRRPSNGTDENIVDLGVGWMY